LQAKNSFCKIVDNKLKMVSIQHFLIVAAALFSIGLAIVMTKRNAIAILIGIELMLNAANLNLVAFSQNDPKLSGTMMALFVVVVAVVESAVALAIILKVYQYYKTIELDQVSTLKD
jgi:NAD(P)H-quinone oxidoreductase subunit 4L